MTTSIKNVSGLAKLLFTLRLCLDRIFYFGRDWHSGELSFPQYINVLRRLLLFICKVQHNKYVCIDGKIRLGLYVPGFPSRAFDQASRKFSTFGVKSPNTTVLVSITSACTFRCEHCYQRLDKGADSPLEPILAAVCQLQENGVAFFNVEGGDPFLAYDRLRQLCAAIDDRSEIWVNSAGKGMTLERLRELKALGLTAVMFSLHSHDPETMNRFMGKPDAWNVMRAGVSLCHQAGVAVAFNSCLTVDQFADGTFEAVMELTRQFGACMVQLIKPKAAGNWLENRHIGFSPEVLTRIRDKVHIYNTSRKYREYPGISAQIIEESPEMFGCTAGGTDRFYINAKGDVQPCEFLNISFGNLNHEPFATIFDRMRKAFDFPGETWLCEKYSRHIAQTIKEKNIDRLPLPPAESRDLYETWDRGAKTDLYRKIEKR